MQPILRGRKNLKYLLFTLYLSISYYSTFSQSIDISLPLNRSVYQRSQSSQAQIPIAVQFKYPEAVKFSYKVEKIDTKTGLSPSPAAIATLNIPLNGLFQTSLPLGAGWYQLVIRTYRPDESLHETSSVKFGVGEVIYSAGQSNLQGVELGDTGPPLLPGAPYDGLSVINQNCFCKKTFPFPVFEKMERGSSDTQKKIAPNGNQNLWCYEVLGRKLSDDNGEIPVALFNAASTGTTVGNWSESADNPHAITNSPWTTNCSPDIVSWGSEGAEGHPYHTLKTALNFYGGMFGARTVIWHQGESDNFIGTAEESYRTSLVNLINRSRQHFSSNLAWAVSRASYFPSYSNTAPIIEAQEQAKNSVPNTTWGAYYSDNFTGADVFRQADDLHFNQNGLIALGEQIATGFFSPFPSPPGYTGITSLTPVEALSVPEIVVTESSGSFILSIPGDYQSYCWVQNDGPVKDCQHSSQSITVQSGKWRCYVTHADPSPVPGHEKRNISLTRNIELPLANFTPALGIRPTRELLD